MNADNFRMLMRVTELPAVRTDVASVARKLRADDLLGGKFDNGHVGLEVYEPHATVEVASVFAY